MEHRRAPEELLSFPCEHLFKAFGPAEEGEAFRAAVQAAVASVIPVGRDSLRTTLSSAGRYQCVTVAVYLEHGWQLTAIYASLRAVANLRYLL